AILAPLLCFFSRRRRHTRFSRDWSSDVCSSDLRGSALVRGRRVAILGRVSMDMTVVDLTAVPEAQVGDVATLIGRDGDEEIALDEVAAQAGTIGYEILTGLTARLPRGETTNGD